MGIVISVAEKIGDKIGEKIAEYIVEPIGRQLGYLCFYERNVDDLKTRRERLGRAEERLQRRVDDASRNGEEIEADVEELLTTVRKIIEDTDKFMRDEEQANTKCCTGAFPIPNLVLRYQLSSEANKKAQDIFTQIENVEKYLGNEKISHLPNLPISVENKDYQEFNTRKQTLSKIMTALRDPNVRVGVWGTGGVGKTMLAKEVARKAKDEEKLFTEVVFSTISQTPTIEKILEDIRKCLGMDKHDDVGERIKNRLRKENNVLLILDDVWKKSMPVISQLADIGISSVEDKKGFKILVTSRDHGVLNNYNDMNVDKACIFEVGFLLEDESMRLFRNIVGDQANKHDFQPLATEIVNECGGLPIAITTVASALKRRRHQVWNNALDELRKSDPVHIDGMHEKVYSSIKLSYDFLQSKEAKKLLLLCSLFQEDTEIPVELLCHYGIGLNLFEGTSTLQVATNKTVTLVETLKDHSLLLMDNDNQDGGGLVKLHDIIRDVVIYIASKDDHFRMRNFENTVAFEEFLATEEFKKTTAISLYDINADEYPETLNSPALKLLRLTKGNRKKFQRRFFEGLDGLLVLHLERVSLDFKRLSLEASPASSFCLLQNLRTLRLIDCDLEDISWIGELKNLKILYLSSRSITKLPEEIGNLNRLQSLHLPGCRNLQVIRPNVISRLTRLEELNLPRFTNWEDGEGAVNANLGEVKNLRHLTNLSLTVPYVNMLPNNMFSEKLDKFNIEIGTVDSMSFGENLSRILMLKLYPNSVLKEHDFEVLLKRSEFLRLSGLKSAKSIAYELDCEGFPNLEDLMIEDSTEILCILNSNENKDNRAAFGKLRDISVSRCNKMKSLFSVYFPEQLERLRVWDCEMVEEIISDGREGDGDLLKISELCYLDLENLPKLVQFKATTKKSDEIREGAQSIDDSVVPLFNGEVVFPRLEVLILEELNVGKIWNGDQLRSSGSGFQNLTTVRVRECDKLKGLIPLSVARSLVHLVRLEVNSCEAMKEIVFVEESTQEAKTFENISFPKLETLDLRNLPNLKRFYVGGCVDYCSSLLQLWILNCPKLRVFPTNSLPTTENENSEDLLDQVDKRLLLNHKEDLMKADQFISTIESSSSKITCESSHLGGAVEEHYDTLFQIKRLDYLYLCGLPTLEQLPKTFQNVETLEIFGCDNLKVLAPPSMSLQTLTILKINSCSGLTSTLFHRSTAKSLSQLRKLFIGGCPNLRQVIANDNKEAHDDLDETADDIVFGQLETLILVDLSSLEVFYSGDSVLKFPCLKNLVVDDCLGMKTFSHGNIDCSMLDKIVGRNKSNYNLRFADYMYEGDDENNYTDGNRWKHWWEGNINTTIQKLWKVENDSSFRSSITLISEEDTEEDMEDT